MVEHLDILRRYDEVSSATLSVYLLPWSLWTSSESGGEGSLIAVSSRWEQESEGDETARQRHSVKPKQQVEVGEKSYDNTSKDCTEM